MEDNFKLIECNEDDVIECGDWTYKVSKLRREFEKMGDNSGFMHDLSNALQNQEINFVPDSDIASASFTKGIDGKMLIVGSNSWKKGRVKLKLSVEFYVEEENTEIQEPESPLDDLRRKINEATS
ncbi:KGK domain-containing protein [Anabaena sp. UHCC 0204]|uniref:KGK domain-containing protein n=1 Tax=Anabaena sp. UHCC 0204 TaxID=2590009 RepID=UPI0014488C71|nr:KGK domain-containing protein [Anabaena sp. UHCC 0204]MTJ07387.1 KGK domain protein [Anabaena sp. UHCC 0204]